jgi:hypothetical protein
VHAVLICKCCSQIFELGHSSKDPFAILCDAFVLSSDYVTLTCTSSIHNRIRILFEQSNITRALHGNSFPTVSSIQLPHSPVVVHTSCHFSQYTNTCYGTCHQIACFKVTANSYNAITRTVKPRRMKTVHSLESSKARNAIMVT